MQKKNILIIVMLVMLFFGGYLVIQTRVFETPPNIVFILTDDMDRSLLPYVPQTVALIGEQGATFDDYFVTTPICCPSRASTLRGQYAHNTDVLENAPGFVRFYKLQEEQDTVNTWLQEAGYRTALYGKYLNNYPVNAGENYVPPGWTDWAAFMANSDDGDFFYDYVMNENGMLVPYGHEPQDYSTDVIRAKSLNFIKDSVKANAPFFLYVSVYAPHGPATAAPRHEDLYTDLAYPQGPSFNEEDRSDKPAVIQSLGNAGDEFDEQDANFTFQKRARSLQAVDELVTALVAELEQQGVLENTYIFFASDNGFRLGEHGLPAGKGTAYEEDIHVPLMVRGPGVVPGLHIAQMTANIDLAPTFADLAGVKAPAFVDGRSFVPLLFGKEVPWRDGLLIEFGYIDEQAIYEAANDPETDNLLVGIHGGAYRGVRGPGYVFVEFTNGEVEYYDMSNDPYQLENLANTFSEETLNALRSKIYALEFCAAAECRLAEDDMNVEIK